MIEGAKVQLSVFSKNVHNIAEKVKKCSFVKWDSQVVFTIPIKVNRQI